MQCCAMKLCVGVDEKGRQQFVDNVNSFLPADIRVHHVTKVTKNFNSKLSCSGRKYQYLLPTYMLQDREAIVRVLEDAFTKQGPVVDAGRQGGYASAGADRFCGLDAVRGSWDALRGFRVDAERLERFREALRYYEGTRPYHNFTTGKVIGDKSSLRYIISFTCSEPFFIPDISSDSEAADTHVEWVLLSVVGQSFLLNQIRKMIGMACEVVKGAATMETLRDVLSPKKVSRDSGLSMKLFTVLYFTYFTLLYFNSMFNLPYLWRGLG
jgi:tRNA pseudouridine38-40 synthase